MGPHDFVAVLEAQDDEPIAKYLLALEAQGT
jgi:uncharacterized protein with GYD domain